MNSHTARLYLQASGWTSELREGFPEEPRVRECWRAPHGSGVALVFVELAYLLPTTEEAVRKQLYIDSTLSTARAKLASDEAAPMPRVREMKRDTLALFIAEKLGCKPTSADSLINLITWEKLAADVLDWVADELGEPKL